MPDPIIQRLAKKSDRTYAPGHQIAEVVFKTGTIVCACGWRLTGSRAVESDWQGHRLAVREALR